MTKKTQLTLRKFWKDYFNIVICLQVIAWEGVTRRTLNFAWKKLRPDLMLDSDFKKIDLEAETGAEPAAVVNKIMSFGKSMGLKTDQGDVEELVKEHEEELSTAKLLNLQEMQHTRVLHELA